MPVGDCEKQFLHAAAADGLQLVRAAVPALNRRGHLGLPPEATFASDLLDAIFVALGGDRIAQAAKTLTPLRGDYLHVETGTFIEVDESQHFTTYRAATLDFYPPDAAIGFDIDEYRELCGTWAPRSDHYYAAKAAVGFGHGGRQRQRAYHDALRDLATPVLGFPALIRVPAPERDGAMAYERVRDRLARLSG
jgi:hypothetical protein